MKRNKKILFVGYGFTIGFFQAYLAQYGHSLTGVVLGEDVLFHHKVINVRSWGKVLLDSLKDKQRRALIKLLSINLENKNLQKTTALQLAKGLNKLIHSISVKHWRHIRNNTVDKLLRAQRYQILESADIVEANKQVVQALFPGLFRDLEKNDLFHIVDEIKRNRPDFLAFQILAQTQSTIFGLIQQIHELYPRLPIIVGGTLVTTSYAQVLKKAPYVIAVIGEGESAFKELIECDYNAKKFHDIAGIAFLEQGNTVITKKRKLLDNLDELPFTNYTFSTRTNPKNIFFSTARGCPFRCSFCSNSVISYRNIRYRSVEHVIQELIYIRKRYPKVININITDDTFLLDKNRVIRFCDEIIQRKLKFHFFCMGGVSSITQEMIPKLEQAGFSKIDFGVESANDTIRKKAHKTMSNDQILSLVKMFENSSIDIRLYLMVGLPGETWQTIRETGLFVQKLQRIKYLFQWTPSIATAYPGTELFMKMQEAGMVDESSWFAPMHKPIYYTVEHSEQELLKMQQELSSYICLDHFFTLKGFLRQWPVVVFSKDRKLLIECLIKAFLKR